MAKNVIQVWREIDKDLSIFPRNLLRDPDRIQDHFFTPHVQNLQNKFKGNWYQREEVYRSINNKVEVTFSEYIPQISL